MSDPTIIRPVDSEERRRRDKFETLMINQMHQITEYVKTLHQRIDILEANAKPKSSIIKLVSS